MADMTKYNKIIIRLHRNFYDNLKLKKQINDTTKKVDIVDSKFNKLLIFGITTSASLLTYIEYQNDRFRTEIKQDLNKFETNIKEEIKEIKKDIKRLETKIDNNFNTIISIIAPKK